MGKRPSDVKKQKLIDRWSPGYSLLRAYVSLCLKKIFYSRVEVFHEVKLPGNRPLIIAPNHQNALMDALNVLANLRQQPIFLARADLFKKPVIANILASMKLAPIFRIRDGKETLKQNDEVFENAVGILERKNIITMFPEGNHGDKEMLRVLKKGIPRIAFLSEQKNDFGLDLQIIPVGINYSDYYKFRSEVFICFGKPFGMDDFRKDFEKNPPLAFTAFNERLSVELKKVMIHISDEAHYELIQLLRTIYLNLIHSEKGMKLNNLKEKFMAAKEMISKLEIVQETDADSYEKLMQKTKSYQNHLIKLKLDDRNFIKIRSNFIGALASTFIMVLLLPAFVFGLVWNILPYQIPIWFCKTKIEDKQFNSSVFFVLASLVTFPLFYFAFSVLAFFLTKFWIALIFIVFLPITGLFAYYYTRFFGKLLKRFRLKFYMCKNNADLKEALKLREEIIEKLIVI